MVRFYLLFLILKLDPFSKAARVWQPELQKAPETRSNESEKKRDSGPAAGAEETYGESEVCLACLACLCDFCDFCIVYDCILIDSS